MATNPPLLAYTNFSSLCSTASRHRRPVTLSAHAAISCQASHLVRPSPDLYGSLVITACMVHCTTVSTRIQLITFPLNGSLLPHPAYCWSVRPCKPTGMCVLDNNMASNLCGTLPATAYRVNHLASEKTLEPAKACPIGDPLTWRLRFG